MNKTIRQLNNFQAEKYDTLDTSTIPSTDRNHRQDRNPFNRHESPFFKRKARLIFEFIKERSSHSEPQHEIKSEEKIATGRENETAESGSVEASQRLNLSPRKNAGKSLTKDSIGEIRDRKFLQQKRKNERFLRQYGYLKHKTINGQRQQNIQIIPSIEDCNERLFLNEVEAMKVQKTIQEYCLLNRKVRPSRRQQQNLNRSINEAERKLKEEQGQESKLSNQSLCLLKTKKMLSMMDMKTTKKQVNIDKVIKSLSQCTNRIYGKRHESDTMNWCAETLKAQWQQQNVNLWGVKREKGKRSRKNGAFSKTAKLLEQINKTGIKTINDF